MTAQFTMVHPEYGKTICLGSLLNIISLFEVCMKRNFALICCLLIALGGRSPAEAQIDINAGDGSQVKIGPGGVFIQSGGNVVKVRANQVGIDQREVGGASQVKIGPGGVSVRSSSNVAKGGSVKLRPAGNAERADKSSLKVKAMHGQVNVRAKAAESASGKSEVRAVENPSAPTSTSSAVLSGNATKTRNFAITSNNSEVSFTCNGDSCTIGSSNNTVTLHGKCGNLKIVGNNNDVICETVDVVSIEGNNNTVTWRSGSRPPTLNVVGNNNETGEASASK
jgi:hypothetical protein